MSWWMRARKHYLFRVTLGYVTLAWLLVLAILVTFPKFDLPEGSVSLAIALLVVGFPIVLFLAWEFKPRLPGTETIVVSRKPLGLTHVALGALVAILAIVAIDQYVLEEIGERSAAVSNSTGPAREQGATANSLGIGIISPTAGSRSPDTGRAHEFSIRLAFQLLGNIRMGSREIRIEFDPRNDESDPVLARRHAIELAQDESIAAILGPVNSNATFAAAAGLRAEGLVIPLVTSLSTAVELTPPGERDSNLFRMIFDDNERMTVFHRAIQTEKANDSEARFLLLHENDAYGSGLERDLASRFFTRNFESMTWCEAISADCAADTVDPALYDAIRTGEWLSPELIERLRRQEFDSLITLGTVPGALAFAHGLSLYDSSLDYFFVGSNKRLFDEAPYGSIIVGNPVLDPSRASDPGLIEYWTNILGEFEKLSSLSPSDFSITSFEAGWVIHAALQSILRNRETLPPMNELRQLVIETLESETFGSLEPWRSIEFDNGSLREMHEAPIYRIDRAPDREDPIVPRAWVNVDIEPRFRYLEGPVRVRLEGHDLDQTTVELWRMENGVARFVDSRRVDFLTEATTVDFHVFVPGTYRVTVAQGNAQAETALVLTPTYLLSVVASLIGALIMVLRENSTRRERVARLLLGVFAGFVLTFSSLYGANVADWFPFPTFGEEPLVNAIVTGLIGGLIGPYVLVEAFLSWALILSVHPANGQRSPKKS